MRTCHGTVLRVCPRKGLGVRFLNRLVSPYTIQLELSPVTSRMNSSTDKEMFQGSTVPDSPVIEPQIMAPTRDNIRFAGCSVTPSPTRRSSVKQRILQFELGSQNGSMIGDDESCDAESVRSRRSGFSNISRIRTEELFNLNLHIPMPDGNKVDHHIKITRSYDPRLVAQEVCQKYGFSYDTVGTRIENEVNRLVAITCLQHTQTFSEELDSTRDVAIEVHGKQKRENVELKKRLLQAKRIIETYDKQLKSAKNRKSTVVVTSSRKEDQSENKLSDELSKLKDEYESKLKEKKNLEKDTQQTQFKDSIEDVSHIDI